jgi:hypothetical protein
MNKQTETKQEQKASQPAKKPYARPELSKHGNVESLTQLIPGGPSCPVQYS